MEWRHLQSGSRRDPFGNPPGTTRIGTSGLRAFRTFRFSYHRTRGGSEHRDARSGENPHWLKSSPPVQAKGCISSGRANRKMAQDPRPRDGGKRDGDACAVGFSDQSTPGTSVEAPESCLNRLQASRARHRSIERVLAMGWTGSCRRRCRKRLAEESLDRHVAFRCGHFLRSVLAPAETRGHCRGNFAREVAGYDAHAGCDRLNKTAARSGRPFVFFNSDAA